MNGSVVTWGDNDRGQLGVGSRVNALTPVAVHVPLPVALAKVSSGGGTRRMRSTRWDASGRGVTTGVALRCLAARHVLNQPTTSTTTSSVPKAL